MKDGIKLSTAQPENVSFQFLSLGVAEGEEPGTNILSQDFAQVRGDLTESHGNPSRGIDYLCTGFSLR